MKKKLLFIIESLTSAGAEKSLVTLLSMLDYSKYDVDLQLFSYGGELECYIPSEVNLLPPLDYTLFLNKGIADQLKSLDFRKIIARFAYSASIRLRKTYHADKARIYWKHVSKCIPTTSVIYDVAIAYAQSIPTFYVADKVHAKKKLAWVNVGYKLEGKNKKFQEQFYEKIDNIVTVSNSSHEIFTNVYPQFSSKMTIIWDMIDIKSILELAERTPEKHLDDSIPALLTIARLNKHQKGYDISREVCKILKNRGLDFKWYAIGKGPFRDEMEEYIHANKLEDKFILLGTTPNPYSYIKACTLYVQTSRHEGFGLSIAEARILNKPVVTTEFDAVWNQMVQGKNGVVVPQNPVAIADAIEDLLTHPDKRNAISEYQRNEKKGNPEELEKFYRLIQE